MQTASFVTSHDGTALAYWRAGSGPPILLVHGGLCDHLAWHFVVPLLARRFSVWTFDRRGHGRSGDMPPYAVDREVDDILAMLSTIGEPTCPVGRRSAIPTRSVRGRDCDTRRLLRSFGRIVGNLDEIRTRQGEPAYR